MNETKKPRWRQRLENFGRALAQLELGCGQESYSDLELAGLVQMFELSFELCWKSLKDLLAHEGFDAKSPRAVIRTALKAGLVSGEEATTLLDALEKRNLLSHTYYEATASEAQRLIRQRYCPVLISIRTRLEESGEV